MAESSELLNALKTSLKWEGCRDSVKRFFLIDKVNGEQKYIERMTLIQKVIKGYAEIHKTEHIQAVTELCKNEDGMTSLQFLAAAYELCSGNDYTLQPTQE